jgi:hypothetical protein
MANANFVARPLQQRLAPLVNEYLSAALLDANSRFPALHLAEALRHTFVHGRLAPSGDDIDHRDLALVCREYGSNLLALVSAHMDATVGTEIRAWNNPGP